MIKAFITDFDGTLANTFEANYASYKVAFKEVANIDFDKQFYKDSFGLRIDDICHNLGIDDQEVIKNIKKAKAIEYKKNTGLIEINAHLQAELMHFRNTGYRTVVATTATRENLTNVLTALNILYMFDIIITGDDVKKGKPDPEVYLKALEKLGLGANEVVVFEDSEAGIEATHRAGIENVIKIEI